jgi:hypothetical protein
MLADCVGLLRGRSRRRIDLTISDIPIRPLGLETTTFEWQLRG